MKLDGVIGQNRGEEKSMRMIDADALMATLGITDMDCDKCAWRDREWGRCKRGGDFEDACCAIENAPTIEERKTGRWILHENQRQEDVDNGNYLYICSECGKSDIHAKTQDVPFCWWCGAKMEVEHD